MSRVRLLGPRDLLERALAFLQTQGVLELRAPPAGATGEAPCVRPRPPDPLADEREAVLEDARVRAAVLRDRLPAVPPGPAASLPPPGTADLAARLAGLEVELGALQARRAALAEEREAADRFSRLVVALAPLRHGVDPALQPELHGLVLRNDPEALSLLAGEVRRIAGDDCEVESRPIDADHVGVLVVVPRAHARALGAFLFERGVEEVKLPSSCVGEGVFEVLLRVAERLRAIPGEIGGVDREIERLAAGYRAALAATAAEAASALERLRASARCGETRFAFVVSGYMPADRVGGLREAVAAELGERVVLLDSLPGRTEWHDVPVMLRNAPAIRPFQRLLALVPLPRYGSVDPTPWLAIFFPLFFGIVLGDVVFGVLGMAVALALRWRGTGGALGRDLAAIAFACSASATVFGLLFGEALGELGQGVGLHPLLLDRRHAVLGFLGVSVALGAVHVATGMALGVVSSAHAGHRREVVARSARLAVLVAAAVAAAGLAGLLQRAVVPWSLGVAGAAIVTAVVAEGPMAALDVLLGMGNVLSYARLMALGLASVLLAEVANLVATALRPAVAGLAVAVLLHAVNFTLGLISPTIAALRLHYVEFFEKFYDAGGEPFRPFARMG
jgi:V/A-type H+-transporting ATPase subunit I